MKEEEPAVAKPRSVCLRSTSLNIGQYSSFGADASNVSGNPQLDSGSVKGAAGNCDASAAVSKTESQTQNRALKC